MKTLLHAPLRAFLGIAVIASVFVALPASPATAADTNCPTAAGGFSGGSGTQADPYVIDDSAALQLLKEQTPTYVDDSFVQTADIDMSSGGNPCVWDRGIGSNGFDGSYDGQGHLISGLNVITAVQFAGLFARATTTATISNVSFQGDVTSTSTSQGYVGALVGWLQGGRITNSSASGDVTSTYDEINFSGTGGLVGVARSGAQITGSQATGDVSADNTAGGLVGRFNSPDGQIIESYSTGSVSVTTSGAGGLVGSAVDVDIARSFATGNVTGTNVTSGRQHFAGFIASISGGSTITDSYSTGSITVSPAGEEIGGFVGDAGSLLADTFTRTYSATSNGIVATGADDTKVGGYGGIERNNVNVAQSFWNSQTAFQVALDWGDEPSDSDIKAKDTASLKALATYTDDTTGFDWNSGSATTIANGWDPSYTWGICSTVNNGYPFLTAFYTVNPCASTPTGPTLNSVTGADSSLTLTWTLGSDGGSPVTDVEYSTDDSATWRSVDDSTATTDTITVGSSGTALVNGTTYQVRVRAVNSVGNGAESNMLPGTPTAPIPPTPPVTFPPGPALNVIATPSDAQAVISWSPPTSTGSFPISDYQVLVSPGGHTCLVVTPTLTCTVTGLTNGTIYTATVRALNGAGWGPFSTASASFTPEAPPTPSIVITGNRAEIRGRPGVIATGVTNNLVGVTVQARVHLSGEIEYYDGSRRVVNANGEFTWQRMSNKKVYVYFRTQDEQVRSNRLIIPR